MAAVGQVHRPLVDVHIQSGRTAHRRNAHKPVVAGQLLERDAILEGVQEHLMVGSQSDPT